MDKPKKRGRPCKNKDKVYTKPVKKNSFLHDKDIVLHLPIQLSEVDDTILPSSPTIGNELTITDSSPRNYNNEKSLKDECVKKDTIIETLRKEIGIYKEKLKNSTTYSNINYEKVNLISKVDGKTIIIEKTDIPCFWCTHQFNTVPCFLPNKYKNGIFEVIGPYCSYECANSYNFLYIKDHKVWERYSLLYKLHKLTTNNDDVSIHISDPKECLEKYGGNKTITQYREKLNTCNNVYKYNIPNIVPISIISNNGTQDITTRKKKEEYSILNYMK